MKLIKVLRKIRSMTLVYRKADCVLDRNTGKPSVGHTVIFSHEMTFVYLHAVGVIAECGCSI